MFIFASSQFRLFIGLLLVSIFILASDLVFGQTAAHTLDVADMARLKDLSSPVFSPDGKWIAYTVSETDSAADKIVTHVWLTSANGQGDHQLVVPENAGSWQPQFTKDSATLATISDQNEAHTAQVWMQSVSGENPRAVTKFEGGVLDYTLAPDGKQLAVIAEVNNGENEHDPIVIDRYQFKDDERGYLTKKRRRLFRVNAEDGSATPLTASDVDVWMPAWSPDGKHIAYVGKREHEGDRHTGFNVYLIDALAGGVPRLVSKDGKTNNDPDHMSKLAWSPDSQQLAYLQGGDEHLLEYAPWELAVADLASGKITRVGKADRNATHPQFGADGNTLLAIVEESRTAYLTRIDLKTGQTKNLSHGNRMDFDFSANNQQQIALLTCDDTHPCRIGVLNQDLETWLPDHNAWLNDVKLARSEDIEVKSKDGTVVHAMLVKPLGYQPGQHYPTIVRVHGGPVYQFSHEFMFDWQVFAAHGYAVLGVNPRGSSGRGFDYAHAIWADWGHKDVQDVLAATDQVVKSGIADKDHLGIGGWSYGGMLTDYTIATDKRFKAAIAGAGAANIFTNYGSDEYIVWLENELGTPWKNLAAYLKVSFPFFHNDRITTPTLFMCSALDFNVPCAGSEQMYQALNSRRIPTQLVIYKDQHHELDVPSYLSDRLTRYVSWYDQYLKNEKIKSVETTTEK